VCDCGSSHDGPYVVGVEDGSEPIAVRVGPTSWRGLPANEIVEVTGSKVAYGLTHGLIERA
jgi:hypothetical protein